MPSTNINSSLGMPKLVNFVVSFNDKGMKKGYFNKAILLFEVFRKHRINGDDLAKAESKSAYLDEKVDEFRLLISMGKDVFAGRYRMNKRSEEHTSELQSLMRISYAVFC